jgi:glycosyltransferase involved in cell wall biosynthesis
VTSKLTITFVAGDLADGGGVNRVIRDLSTIFTEKLNAAVTVIGVETTGAATYPFSPKVTVQTTSRGNRIGWRDALASLRRDPPDFVIGSWTQANLILTLGLLFSRAKVIVIEHTSWYFHRRRIWALRRLIYPLAWRVIVLNPKELAHYGSFLRGVRLLPNPVPSIPQAPSKREKLIVAIGHLEPRKNFIDAIRAMALSGLEDDGWELAIVGSGPDERALGDAIRQSRLTRTRIHPPTSDLAPWYNRAALTVVTAKLEVFSLVLAEAMSAGVVPIAYATDGPSFILQDFPGHLVGVGDVKALAERMRHFAETEVPRAPLRAAIEKRFAPEVVAAEWKSLFSERRRR